MNVYHIDLDYVLIEKIAMRLVLAAVGYNCLTQLPGCSNRGTQASLSKQYDQVDSCHNDSKLFRPGDTFASVLNILDNGYVTLQGSFLLRSLCSSWITQSESLSRTFLLRYTVPAALQKRFIFRLCKHIVRWLILCLAVLTVFIFD